MIFKGEAGNINVNSDLKIRVIDESLIDIWTDILMKGYGVPEIFHGALGYIY